MGERVTILLVEDDEALRRMLSVSLGSLGRVVTARSGDDALEQLEDMGPPSLVVSDVMMPGMTGLELVRAMRSDPRLAHVPVVLLSAKTDARAVIDGINAGARHYVTKPFKTADLTEKVARLIRTNARATVRAPPMMTARSEDELAAIEIDVSDLCA